MRIFIQPLHDQDAYNQTPTHPHDINKNSGNNKVILACNYSYARRVDDLEICLNISMSSTYKHNITPSPPHVNTTDTCQLHFKQTPQMSKFACFKPQKGFKMLLFMNIYYKTIRLFHVNFLLQLSIQESCINVPLMNQKIVLGRQ